MKHLIYLLVFLSSSCFARQQYACYEDLNTKEKIKVEIGTTVATTYKEIPCVTHAAFFGCGQDENFIMKTLYDSCKKEGRGLSPYIMEISKSSCPEGKIEYSVEYECVL